MDIVSLSFEEPLIIAINHQQIRLVPFKTIEPGNVKFGIEAPKSISIHREEIFQAIQARNSGEIG